MTDKMEALKNHYSRYLDAMTAEHEGSRSVDVELVDSPEPFEDSNQQEHVTSAKGFISLHRRR